MTGVKIVSWNMNHKARTPEQRSAAWRYLSDVLQADVALVQEASPPDHITQVYQPIDALRYNWGSAVVILRPGLSLRTRPRIPLPDCYLTPLTGDALPDSHPGACAVGDILDAQGTLLFTAISLYGQWEVMPNGSTYSCPRMHRMLSDLTSVLAPSKRKPVILAGDLNTTTQGAASKGNQAAIVFGRLRAWGLVDCIDRTRTSRSGLTCCKGPDGDLCSHVRTYRHNNDPESEPTQWDYAFASESIVHTMKKCQVVDEEGAWNLSDHCPIALELEIGPGPKAPGETAD